MVQFSCISRAMWYQRRLYYFWLKMFVWKICLSFSIYAICFKFKTMDHFGLTTVKCWYFVYLTLFWMFLYCYIATRIAITFVWIGQAVHESYWYNYPVAVQQCLRLIIRRSQRPLKLNGLNIIQCNLEAFVSVRDWNWLEWIENV